MPKRIQLRRTKGWRKPEGAVNVARPTRWGNPFRPGPVWIEPFQPTPDDSTPGVAVGSLVILDLASVLALYRQHIIGTFGAGHIGRELAGKDLACWCPLDQPCHADVLLEVANQ